MRKIILTTVGTLGDLHPFIAIALALKQRGFAPVLAVAEDQAEKCRDAGLKAVVIFPSFEAISQRMGLTQAEAVTRIMANQREMLQQVLLPGLSVAAEALDAMVGDAEAIVASPFVFAAPIIAGKRDLPLITVILQPMAMLSAYDPPCTPDFWMLKRAPLGTIGRGWNRFAYTIIRLILNGLYGRRIDRVRIENGLSPAGAKHLLEPGSASVLCLGCYSPQLASRQPDALPCTDIVGFPRFDSQSGRAEILHPLLTEFLDSGPAPIIFTLGSFAVNSAGTFYERATTAANHLGMRAILLTGRDCAPTIAGNILTCGYAPHSLLFPAAAAIVHHGGIGTTGEALCAGKPQLVVPHMGDQNDHAYRIYQMGVGLRLKASRFTVERAVALLAALLEQPSYAVEAANVAKLLIDENGADAAAGAIESALNVFRRSDDRVDYIAAG